MKRTITIFLDLRKLFVLVFFFNSIFVLAQTTHNITNPEQLTAAFSATLGAGDTVILANGTYSSDARVKFSPTTGTSTMPITLRPQTPGGVKFTGGLKMSIGGDYVVIDGFHWQGGFGASNFIEFRDGFDYANYSTIQNCAIDGLTVDPDDIEVGTSVKHRWIVLYGTYNTVINCTFMNKSNAGALVLVELEYNASPDDGITNTRCLEVGHTISNNYFYKYDKIDPNLSNSGDSETIRVGTSEFQNVNSNTTVSNNYFVESDGENEIITNKSKGNIYTNNTFRRCRGSLVLRHGSNALVDGNYFLGENVDGTGGIRIVDSNHIITNNYIQDCITVGANAIWNNGITFLGGNDNNAVACNSTSTSNGYQKAFNNNLSNNSIVNTNAPFFFNVNTGTTNVTGTVSNNLIYFADTSAPRYSEVITGNGSGYSAFGTALAYTGNVYNGTTLGTGPASGFSLDSGITAAVDGEIFTFSGATGKGANTSNSSPITDAMVGDGIGACFLDYLGATINNPTCTIVVGETLIVGSLSPYTYEAGSKTVSVTANVSWTAVSNDAWISIDTNSGSGDAAVSVTVTENMGTTDRSGTVTFTQDAGGDDIVRVLNIIQDAPPPPDPRDGLNLINPLADDVVAVYACNEEINPPTKNNPKEHSLDKDPFTQWAGTAAASECAGFTSIIYDLKGAFDLSLVDIATTGGKTYNLQIWVSSTIPVSPELYPDASDFTLVYPSSGFFQISTTPENKVPYTLPTPALDTRYVKIIGDGQPGGSRFTTIHEIEFYGAESLSTKDNTLDNNILIYPVPTKNTLYVKNVDSKINTIQIFNIDGRKIIHQNINNSEFEIDLTTISNGTYIINFLNNGLLSKTKLFIIAH
tara:strand:- start:8511 stop:11108 length:2598 start_codon:yes stop_codon:yes gene_type:complete